MASGCATTVPPAGITTSSDVTAGTASEHQLLHDTTNQAEPGGGGAPNAGIAAPGLSTTGPASSGTARAWLLTATVPPPLSSRLTLGGVPHRVEWSRQQATGLVVKLAGVDDRTAARAQLDRYLEVPDHSLRPLPAGRWYHHDLVGLSVRSESGRDLGTLTEVVEPPANDVWVARRGGEELLIPVIPDAVLAVDLSGGTVTVADWLLDAEDV